MKHIKLYKIFESNDMSEILADLKDISLEVQDIGLSVYVAKYDDGTQVENKNIPKSVKESIRVCIYSPTKFEIKSISECVLRMIDFMKIYGYKMSPLGYGIDPGEYIGKIEPTKIQRIEFVFYKFNDTYHVIWVTNASKKDNYLRFNLLKRDLSKEEAEKKLLSETYANRDYITNDKSE